MKFKPISSFRQLSGYTEAGSPVLLLLIKGETELGRCAVESLNDLGTGEMGYEEILTVDVNSVKDIHPYFKIDSVPVLLELKGDRVLRAIKGCNKTGYYRAIFSNKANNPEVQESKSQPRVTVYSTPTCTWCNTLKNYLNENHVRYNDIDVSANQRAAEDMVKKSGQQGVPQTDINGEVIVGFDKNRIDRLLSLN